MMPTFCVEFLTHHIFNCLGLGQSITTFAMDFGSHWTFQPKEVESSVMTIISTSEDPFLGYWDISCVFSAPTRSVASMVFKPLIYTNMLVRQSIIWLTSLHINNLSVWTYLHWHLRTSRMLQWKLQSTSLQIIANELSVIYNNLIDESLRLWLQ